MRCPKGFVQKPPKSGNCVAKSKKLETKKVSKSKRCPKGTRKNKKTGECEKKSEISFRKTRKVASLKKTHSPKKTPAKKMYKIVGLTFSYPQNPKDYKKGLLGLDSLTIREGDNRDISYTIEFYNGTQIIELVNFTRKVPSYTMIDLKTLKNTVNMEDLEKTLSVSNLVDLVANELEYEYIEEGNLVKTIKINITSQDLDAPNKEDLEQILKETVKVLKNL